MNVIQGMAIKTYVELYITITFPQQTIMKHDMN